MVGNVIEQHFQAVAMRVGQKRIEIIQGTKDRIDVGVVADIVAEVSHWRRIDRRNPDGVHAEPLQIVEFAPNANEITNAIAVAVHKRAWIDLIDDATLPPSKYCELQIIDNHLNILSTLIHVLRIWVFAAA